MNNVINIIGLSIIAAKYTMFALLAMITVYTGMTVAEPMLLADISNDN
ncbi:hypothetical protein [Vibrio maerlii]|nr:hypothetical protein [Vibrio maerlii]